MLAEDDDLGRFMADTGVVLDGDGEVALGGDVHEVYVGVHSFYLFVGAEADRAIGVVEEEDRWGVVRAEEEGGEGGGVGDWEKAGARGRHMGIMRGD